MFVKIRNKLATWVGVSAPVSGGELVVSRGMQVHPAQRNDVHQLYAPQTGLVPLMVHYALNNWVYTAVNKIAALCATSEFMITSRPDGMERDYNHPLLAMLGKYGRPNDHQDSFEFFEQHFINCAIAGNSYWFWDDAVAGRPTAVRHLAPEKMRVIPGRNRTIARYEYWDQGAPVRFSPEQITHFKTANPFNRYYGLSAMQVLYFTVLGDNYMLQWNNDYFDDKLGVPDGIMVVSDDTSDQAIEVMRDEFVARHGEGRRVAFVRSDAGKAVWLDAGLKHKDYDFEKGRRLNRQAVFEALDLPLGIMSENSTEAHAIVSERRFSESIRIRHIRTARKLNVDGLNFWPAQKKWQTDFDDVTKQSVDWRKEKDRISSQAMMLSLDEMRMRELKLPPLVAGQLTIQQSMSVKDEVKSDGTE